MKQRRCIKCAIHGEEQAHTWRECKWRNCDCRKCQLMFLQRKVENKVKRQCRKKVYTSTYVCSRCRHHGIITGKKYHSPCPYQFCKCKKCELFEEKKRIENELILVRHREMINEIVDTPPEDPARQVTQSMETDTESSRAESYTDTESSLTREAKVILQLLTALASYPNSIAPHNLDHEALSNLFKNPLITLPENWMPVLPEIIELVYEAVKRFQLI